MRFSSHNLGIALAVLSGCAFLFSAYLADRHALAARALLAVGGLFLLGSGIFFGLISGGGGRSAVALVADLAPGLLALVSALVIGPTERRAYP